MFRSSECEIKTTHLKKVELKLTNIEQDNGILESELAKKNKSYLPRYSYPNLLGVQHTLPNFSKTPLNSHIN